MISFYGGPQGIEGVKGDQGLQGEPGKHFNIKETYYCFDDYSVDNTPNQYNLYKAPVEKDENKITDIEKNNFQNLYIENQWLNIVFTQNNSSVGYSYFNNKWNVINFGPMSQIFWENNEGITNTQLHLVYQQDNEEIPCREGNLIINSAKGILAEDRNGTRKQMFIPEKIETTIYNKEENSKYLTPYSTQGTTFQIGDIVESFYLDEGKTEENGWVECRGQLLDTSKYPYWLNKLPLSDIYQILEEEPVFNENNLDMTKITRQMIPTETELVEYWRYADESQVVYGHYLFFPQKKQLINIEDLANDNIKQNYLLCSPCIFNNTIYSKKKGRIILLGKDSGDQCYEMVINIANAGQEFLEYCCPLLKYDTNNGTTSGYINNNLQDLKLFDNLNPTSDFEESLVVVNQSTHYCYLLDLNNGILYSAKESLLNPGKGETGYSDLQYEFNFEKKTLSNILGCFYQNTFYFLYQNKLYTYSNGSFHDAALLIGRIQFTTDRTKEQNIEKFYWEYARYNSTDQSSSTNPFITQTYRPYYIGPYRDKNNTSSQDDKEQELILWNFLKSFYLNTMKNKKFIFDEKKQKLLLYYYHKSNTDPSDILVYNRSLDYVKFFNCFEDLCGNKYENGEVNNIIASGKIEYPGDYYNHTKYNIQGAALLALHQLIINEDPLITNIEANKAYLLDEISISDKASEQLYTLVNKVKSNLSLNNNERIFYMYMNTKDNTSYRLYLEDIHINSDDAMDNKQILLSVLNSDTLKYFYSESADSLNSSFTLYAFDTIRKIKYNRSIRLPSKSSIANCKRFIKLK